MARTPQATACAAATDLPTSVIAVRAAAAAPTTPATAAAATNSGHVHATAIPQAFTQPPSARRLARAARRNRAECTS